MGVHGSAGVHFFDLLFNSEATALMSSGQDFFDLRHCLLQRLLRVNHDIARGGVCEREEDRLASVGLYADEPGTRRSAVDACDDRVDDRRRVFAPGVVARDDE